MSQSTSLTGKVSRHSGANISIGLEGTLFSETVHEPARLDYMLMPKMVALAERAWAPDPQWTKQTDHAHAAPLHAAAWSVFVSQLGLKVLPQLDAEHAVLYRIPAPGLKQVAGAVLVNQQIPGFSLRYTVDGSEPNATSPLVTGPTYPCRSHPGRGRRSQRTGGEILAN